MRLMRIGFVAAIVAMLWPGAVRAVEYSENFDQGRPPEQVFNGILKLGTDGSWTGALADGRYVLSNDAEASAVRYYYMGGTTGDFANARVSADVAIEQGEGVAGAGLLYRFDPATKTYLAFLVMPDGKYGVIERTGSGGRMKMSGTHNATAKDGSYALRVEAEGNMLHFFVNDAAVASMSTSLTGKGTGIVAFGKGRFAFDNFALSTP